jgi:hypothetical protein
LLVEDSQHTLAVVVELVDPPAGSPTPGLTVQRGILDSDAQVGGPSVLKTDWTYTGVGPDDDPWIVRLKSEDDYANAARGPVARPAGAATAS